METTVEIEEVQAQMLRALAHPFRIRLLEVLSVDEECVCHLVALFDKPQPFISQHLAALKEAGLVKDRREGKWMHYRLNESDLFKRLLFLSIADRVTEEEMANDRRRLEVFIASRAEELPDVPAGCCAGV